MISPKPVGVKISELQCGKRYALGILNFEKATNYEREIMDETRTIWRYAFRDPISRRLVVYSGAWLGRFQFGELLSVTGTIKKQEPEFNTTRIKFPKVKKVLDNPLGF